MDFDIDERTNGRKKKGRKISREISASYVDVNNITPFEFITNQSHRSRIFLSLPLSLPLPLTLFFLILSLDLSLTGCLLGVFLAAHTNTIGCELNEALGVSLLSFSHRHSYRRILLRKAPLLPFADIPSQEYG